MGVAFSMPHSIQEIIISLTNTKILVANSENVVSVCVKEPVKLLLLHEKQSRRFLRHQFNFNLHVNKSPNEYLWRKE